MAVLVGGCGGVVPSSAEHWSSSGERQALFCPPHTGPKIQRGLFGCIAADVLISLTFFWACVSHSFCLHGLHRPRRSSASARTTCWGSALPGDSAQEPQLDTKGPALDSRHAQVLHSHRGKRQTARAAAVSAQAVMLLCHILKAVSQWAQCGDSSSETPK